MKRSGSLRRVTPLRSKSRLVKKTVGSSSDFPPEIRKQIAIRSVGRCEAVAPPCDGRADQIHHILRRSQGGQGTFENGLAVCTSCHNFIHANPAISRTNGWLAEKGAAYRQ